MNTIKKEHPILFSAPMVRALLDGTKTQTRRVLKQATGLSLSVGMDDDAPGVAELSWLWGDGPGHEVHETIKRVPCPYGQPGDQLWVRETHAIVPRTAYAHSEGVQQTLRPDDPYEHDAAIYREGWTRSNGGFSWRPSIHMPRWASRISLEITGVRVERLQDISRDDAMAEGIVIQPDGGFGLADTTHYHFVDPRESYWSLWEAINGPGSVEANPWVWAVAFKVIKP